MEDLSLEGSVVAVSSNRGHHFSKPVRSAIVMVEDIGIDGDAHAGAFVRHRYLARRRPRRPNQRQVHLIPNELLEALRDAGHYVSYGGLGETVTTTGLELERLPLGANLADALEKAAAGKPHKLTLVACRQPSLIVGSQWLPSHRADVAWPWQRHCWVTQAGARHEGCVAGSAAAAAMSCSELCQKDMPYRAGCGRIAVEARLGLLKRTIGESQGRRS
jgi:hypothetical protein